MALRGCICLDHLPLQILLNDNPAWEGTPVALTKDEKPQSPILALNPEARERGLAVGMRYASALSLVPNLRARAVPRERIAETQERIVRLLSTLTPDIEPCPFDDDALWVSVEGLHSLYSSESCWAVKVSEALASEGLRARVVLGFTRFGTYAVARWRPRSMVLASRKEEYALMSRSPIDVLPLSPRTKGTLRKLEVRTVHQFVSLPEGETVRRFGKEAGHLRRAILDDDPLPIQPRAVNERLSSRRHLDSPLTDLNLLMPLLDELLAVEAQRAESQNSVISGLTFVFRTEDGEKIAETIHPAAPTLRISVLRRLVQLRLSSRRFSSGVEDVEIRSAWSQPSRAQEELFALRRRDLPAGARAFAAIRARFGNESVSYASPRDSHLPERSFSLVPLTKPSLPSMSREKIEPGQTTAVRRILLEPAQVPHSSLKQVEKAEHFTVSGQWWGTGEKDAPFDRDYTFLNSPRGILWLFEDSLTDTWWVQGVVD